MDLNDKGDGGQKILPNEPSHDGSMNESVDEARNTYGIQ